MVMPRPGRCCCNVADNAAIDAAGILEMIRRVEACKRLQFDDRTRFQFEPVGQLYFVGAPATAANQQPFEELLPVAVQLFGGNIYG